MTRSKRFTVALVLNLLLVAGLVSVGIAADSLGVLAAGADYLADAAAIAVAIVANRLSERHPRADAFAALVNGGWLLVLSILIVAGSTDRLVSGTPEVHGLPVLVMSAIAAAAMTSAAVVLGRDVGEGDEALSHRAVLLDTAADAASATGVAITGAVILATGSWNWLDPAVAVAIAVVIAYHAIRLLLKVREAGPRVSRPKRRQDNERQPSRPVMPPSRSRDVQLDLTPGRRVRAGAPVADILPEAARELVVPRAAAQCVVSGPAGEHVVPGQPEDAVVA